MFAALRLRCTYPYALFIFASVPESTAMDSDFADEISDAQVQRTLKIIQSAPFTPAEHRLLSSLVRDSVSPKATSIYLLRRISKDESSEQYDEQELWRLLTDWKFLVDRCEYLRLSAKIFTNSLSSQTNDCTIPPPDSVCLWTR